MIDVLAELFRTKCLHTAKIIAIFSDFCYFEIKPEMWDFPHDYGTVDTYEHLTLSRVKQILYFMDHIHNGHNEEPCKIRHQWQHLTHQVLTTCIVTHAFK